MPVATSAAASASPRKSQNPKANSPLPALTTQFDVNHNRLPASPPPAASSSTTLSTTMSPTSSSLICHADHDHVTHTNIHPHHVHDKEWDNEFTNTLSLPQHSSILMRTKYAKLVSICLEYSQIVDRYTRTIIDDLWSSHHKEYTLSSSGVTVIKGIIFSLAQDIEIVSSSPSSSLSSSPITALITTTSTTPVNLSSPQNPYSALVSPKKSPPPPPTKNHCSLRILDSPRYLFGKSNPSQEAAVKAQGNHFRNLQTVFEFFHTIEVMPIPTFAIQLEYRGRKLSAHPSFDPGELLYGATSTDEEAVARNSDSYTNTLVNQISDQLHLAPHMCGKNNVTLALPQDAQVYRTKNGNLRLRNIARLMPEEYFDEKDREGQFLGHTDVRVLRPEFLVRLKEAGKPPLSPDCLISKASDSEKHKLELIAAARYLHDTCIPLLQTELLESWSKGHPILDSSHHSVEMVFHTRGINMRHLGKVFLGVRDVNINADFSHPQSLLFAEMCSRAFKHYLRAIMRDESGHQHSISACMERLVPILNSLINLEDSCWNILVEGMCMRFSGFLPAHLLDFGVWRATMSNIRKIMQPALAKTGIIVAEQTWDELVKEPNFIFHSIHLLKIEPVVKQLSYSKSAVGSRLFGETKITKSSSVRRKLFHTMQTIYSDLKRKHHKAKHYAAGLAIARSSLENEDENFLISDKLLVNHILDDSNHDHCLLSVAWMFWSLFHNWETRVNKFPLLSCSSGAADVEDMRKIFACWSNMAQAMVEKGQHDSSYIVINLCAARVRAFEALFVLIKTGDAQQAIQEEKVEKETISAVDAIERANQSVENVQTLLPVVGTSGRIEALEKALTLAFDSNISQLLLLVVGACLQLDMGIKRWLIRKALTLENLKGFETLLKTEIDVRDEMGLGVLHIATAPSVVKHLISQGADLGSLCRGGRTPLISAVYQKNCGKMEAILDAMHGQVSLVNTQELSGHTALSIALCTGCHIMVKRLLLERADPNLSGPEGFSMLQFATVKAPLATIQDLLTAGAQVNYQDGPMHFTALMFAAKRGRSEIVKLLFENGADMMLNDDAGQNALMHACGGGAADNVEVCEMLIAQALLNAHNVKYYVNMKDHRSRTPLLHALRKKKHACVPLLLKYGAQVTEPDCYGSTAVDYCNACDDDAMRATRKLITQVQLAEENNVVGPQGWFKKVNSFSKPGRKLNLHLLSPSSSTSSLVSVNSFNSSNSTNSSGSGSSRSSSSGGSVSIGGMIVPLAPSASNELPKYGELIKTTTLMNTTTNTTMTLVTTTHRPNVKDNYNYGYGAYDEKNGGEEEPCPPSSNSSNYDDDNSLYRPYSFNDLDLSFDRAAIEMRKNTKTVSQWKDSFVSVFALPTSFLKQQQLEVLLTELESVSHEFSVSEQQSVDFLICTSRHLLRESREHQHFQDEKFQAKDWNEQFCRAVVEPDLVLKYQKLNQLSMDFITLITNYGRTIISELFLEEGKTVAVRDLGGAAGGRKYVVRGILFKLAKDVNHGGQWLYGGHAESYENSNKGAAHDLRGASACFRFHEKGVFVPMQALLDFHGYRLVCMPMLPLATDTLIWGSADGGKTIHRDDHNFNDLMKEVAREIHLAEHLVMASGDRALGIGPQEVSMSTAGDVEGHKGKDGRFYLLDLARLLPPQDPTSCKHLEHKSNAVFFRLFRPEFLSSFKTLGHPPLSPDALTNWGNWPQAPKSCTTHNENIRSATKLLVEVVIPEFVDFLLRLPLAKLSRLSIPQEAHRRGINIHHLGLVYTLLNKNEQEFTCLQIQRRTALERMLVEIVGRVVKNLLRNTLRNSHKRNKTQPSEFDSINTVVEFLNDFMRGPYGGGARRWGEIERGFFPRYGLTIPDLWARLDQISGSRHAVVNYVINAVGIVLHHDTTVSFIKNSKTDELFEFSSMDIQSLSVRVKYMSIIDQSSAELLNMNVQKSLAETLTCNESSERLLLLAVNTLARNLTSDPLNRSLSVKADILKLQYKAFMLRKKNMHCEADFLFLMAIEHAIEEGLQELAVGLGRLLLAALQEIDRQGNLHLMLFGHIEHATKELFNFVPEALLDTSTMRKSTSSTTVALSP